MPWYAHSALPPAAGFRDKFRTAPGAPRIGDTRAPAHILRSCDRRQEFKHDKSPLVRVLCIRDCIPRGPEKCMRDADTDAAAHWVL